MRKIYKALCGLEGIKKLSKQYSFSLSDYIQTAESLTDAQVQAMLADGVVAHIAQQRDIQPTLIQEIDSLVRKALRSFFRRFEFSRWLNNMSAAEVSD